MVVSSVSTTGRIFESTDVSLLCIVTVAPLDVESVVNITWFGPNGMITMNDTRYSFNTDRSLLTFTTALSDNGAQYYCTASYGASVAQSSLIFPSATTSANTTVNVESKLNYMQGFNFNYTCNDHKWLVQCVHAYAIMCTFDYSLDFICIWHSCNTFDL